MIGRYLKDTITILDDETDQFGMPVAGTDALTQYPCRIEQSERVVLTAEGAERRAAYSVFLTSDAAISVGDRIIPFATDAITGLERVYTALAVSPMSGFAASHIEVQIG